MSVTRDHILAEVRRTAAANGGKPLGRLAFLSETGIREAPASCACLHGGNPCASNVRRQASATSTSLRHPSV